MADFQRSNSSANVVKRGAERKGGFPLCGLASCQHVRHEAEMSCFADFSRVYTIRFPAQPADEYLERLRAAGMKYERPMDPFKMGHTGQPGFWRGRLTTAQLTTLGLPSSTTIEQDDE